MPIRCILDQTEVDLSTISVIPMNFGQPRLWSGRSASTYQLQVPHGEIPRLLAQEYTDYCRDSRVHPAESEPLTQALANLGWPVLADLLGRDPVTYTAMVRFLGHDLLLAIEAEHAASSPAHILLSVDSLNFAMTDVVLTGKALPAVR